METHDEPKPPVTPGPTAPELGYEVRDTNTRAVAWGGVILVATVAVVLIALLFVYRKVGGVKPRHEALTAPVTLANELAELRREEDAILGTYAYDRATGVVRLPIDRAIDLVARRGVPAGKGPRTDLQINSRDRTPESDGTPTKKADTPKKADETPTTKAAAPAETKKAP